MIVLSIKGDAELLPVERLCGKCWKPLRPEEEQCSNCGSFCIAEPLPIKMNKAGPFEGKIKLNSKHKISRHGKPAIDHS
jgi:hypothetical protein